MVHRTEVGVDSCPFSVEVVAKQAGDGKMQTKPYSSSSILDRCPDSDPALVPVGSCSESDNSSEEGETPSTVSHSRRKQLKVTPSALGVVPTAPVGADDAGVIDCLSDQFSNLFCPADAIHRGKDSPKSEPYRGCTALHFEDLVGHPGMLSFCRGDVDGLSETMNHKPTNRVSISRKRRAAHVTNLWNEWHTDSAIPLEKSKSMPSSPSPSMQDLQFDVFYDSDPEQEHREKSERLQRLEDPPKIRRSYKSRRPPPIDTIFEDECFDIEAPPRPCAPRSIYHPGFNFDPKPLPYESPVVNVARPSYLDSPLGLPEFALVHPGGDEYLKNFVQEVSNTRISLVWHRHSGTDESVVGDQSGIQPTIRAPTTVTAAFEVGAHLDQMVVQPKFTWSQSYQPDLQKKRVSVSSTEPNSIDLLSIIRVLKPKKLDRTLYPFARLERTLCITTNDERYPYLVFECPSPPEREWLVTSLKMVVARLASIIIVRDEAMLLEFFSPYAALFSLADKELDDAGEKLVGDETPSLNPNGELHLVSYGDE